MNDFKYYADGVLADLVKTFFHKILDPMVQSIVHGIEHVVGYLLTIFLSIYTEVAIPKAYDASAQAITPAMKVQSLLAYPTMAIFAIAVIITGVKLIFQLKGDGYYTIKQFLGYFIFWLIIVSTGTIFAQLLVDGGDYFTNWILNETALSVKGQGTLNILATLLTTLGTMGVADIIVWGPLLGILFVIEIMMMIFRAAVITVLIGFLPLVCTAGYFGWGRAWWRRTLNWLIAFILYKPISVVIIYAGMNLIQSAQIFSLSVMKTTTGLDTLLEGVMLLVIAVIAMPALLRLVHVVPENTTLRDIQQQQGHRQYINQMQQGMNRWRNKR